TGTVSFTSTPRFDVVATTDVTVTLYEGTTAIGSAVSIAGAARVAVSSPRTEGTHTVYAKGVDLAGNASAVTPSRTYLVDTVAPTTTSVSLYSADDAGGGTTSNPRPRLQVRTEAGTLVTLY